MGDQKHQECYCGARIHRVGEPLDVVVWVDDRGGELCYPSESGADGEARHDPCGAWEAEQ